MGRKGPRAKTKTVLKSVNKWEQFGSMQNLKFQTLLIKNHPISQVEMHPQKTARMKIQLN